MRLYLVAAIVVFSIVFVGFCNGRDIENCKKAGNSEEVCYQIVNP